MNFDKVVVAGTGISGISAAKLLLKANKEVILYDGNEKLITSEIEKNFDSSDNINIILGELKQSDLENIDLMVISPGIPVDAPFTNIVRENNIPIWSEIELANYFSKGTVVAITGTNGKTTTTTLVGEIMKAYYKSVFVVGNIGIPYTSIALDTREDSVIVAEISSFQLETIVDFKPKVSAILNVTPDHLNRHYTFENYANTKKKISMNQDNQDKCILNYDDEITRNMAKSINSDVLFFSRESELNNGVYLANDKIVISINGKRKDVCLVSELKLLGTHNVENVMAAILMAYSMEVPIDIIKKVVTEFMGVEHRIEYVDTINNVTYYNDSKGTNPDAAIKGIQAMTRKTVLIGGGYDKKVPFDDWIKSFDNKVRYLVLIGATAEIIAQTAQKQGFSDIIFAETLKEAVDICYEKAMPGDAVLLSPACASWGMFNNYEERGRFFKEYVRNLKG